MVYRTAPEGGTRGHATVALRLGAAGTDAVVESLRLRSTHHDAYRFFTAPARPRNPVAPTRADRSRTSRAAFARRAAPLRAAHRPPRHAHRLTALPGPSECGVG